MVNLFGNAELINRNFTIVSDDCWGGMIYKSFGLPYLTPFMWVGITPLEYLKLLSNLKEYLKCTPIQIYKPEYNFPIGMIGDICIYFIHSTSFEDGINKWCRRVERINWDNIFVKMAIFDESQAIEFDKLPFKNKVGFTPMEYNLESCICMNEWQNPLVASRYFSFGAYVQLGYMQYFDVVKWLNTGNGRI